MNRSKTRSIGIALDAAAVVAHPQFDTRGDVFASDSQMSPPSGVYLAALLRMLTTTCVRRIGSPKHSIG